MAVLVEAISVAVRLDAIDARFVGGWAAFLASVPNRTLCADADLARVGFMAPEDVLAYVTELEAGGLVYLCKGEAQDLAVLDQLHGPTVNAPWLDFGTIYVDEFKGEWPLAGCWGLSTSRWPRRSGGSSRARCRNVAGSSRTKTSMDE